MDRYRDMMMQNTMTTVVEPRVSVLVGKEIFRNSLFTSFVNSTVDAHIFLNMIRSACQCDMAGAPGIEPGPSVLETDVLAVEHHAPLDESPDTSGTSMSSKSSNSTSRRAVARSRRRPRRRARFSKRFLIISLPCEMYVCGKTGRICSAPAGPDRS